MILSAIAAMAENNTIGLNNSLPWHLTADLKRFKAITTGRPIIMGRKTFLSIGRPLPNRTNIVITRDRGFKAEGCLIANSIDDAIALAEQHATDEVFVIGGEEIYRQLLPKVSRLYLTIVHHPFEGDAYFPTLMPGEWQEVSRERHASDLDNPYEYSFVGMERVLVSAAKDRIYNNDFEMLK